MLFSKTPTFNPDKDIPSLAGKVIVITDGMHRFILPLDPPSRLIHDRLGDTELGRDTVLGFAKHDPAAIYLCSRHIADGENATRYIQNEVHDASIRLLQLDLSSLDSIASAAETFISQQSRLDILINNAGIMCQDGTTEQGYELQLGNNHLGHALFTRLLMPVLSKTARLKESDVRIINLSSTVHSRAPGPGFDPKNLMLADANSMDRYGRSKLANILYTKKLAALHQGITTVAVYPGVIQSDLYKPIMNSYRILPMVGRLSGGLIHGSIEKGANNTLWAATASKDLVESGSFYTPVGIKNLGSYYARDPDLAQILWEWTKTELQKHGY